jgi:hypothetical protein
MTAQDAANLCNCNGGIDPFKDEEIDELENEKEQDGSFNEPPCTRGKILHSDMAVFSAAK